MTLKNIKLSDKTLKIVVAVGIVIIALLFLSSFLGSQKDETPPPNATISNEQLGGETASLSEYKNSLEKSIKGLLENIKGVGKTEIFITLESGFENLYVTEENINLDTTGETAQRRSSEKKTLLVEDQNGRKTALLKKTINPIVGGVVVVCEGGDDPVVVQNATEALKAALCINMTRICVKPLKIT